MTARVLLTSVAALCLFHGSSWAVQYDALALYLDFEEGAGDTAMDASKHGNNGTLHMAEWADGKYGKAISLSGAAGGWVEVPDAPSLDIVDEITLMAWVYPTTFNNEWQRIVNKCWAGDTWPWMSYGFYEMAGTDGRLGFTIAVDNGQERLCRNGETPQLPSNEWSHIAATYDGSDHAPLPGRRGGAERPRLRYRLPPTMCRSPSAETTKATANISTVPLTRWASGALRSRRMRL